MTNKTLAIIVAIASVVFAISPWVTPGFDGFSANQFPVPQIDPAVQPSGYTFSIWGLIYLWLILGAGFGALKAVDNPDWTAMRLPLLVSLTIGIFWVAVAIASPEWAALMIFVMMVAAIAAMLRAGSDRPWLLVRPIALYAGWLTAATGVAIGVLLGGYGILGEQAAAIVCIIGVLAVALTVQSMRPAEWGYPASIIWALIGVINANISNSNWVIIILAAIGAGVLTFRAARSVMKGQST